MRAGRADPSSSAEISHVRTGPRGWNGVENTVKLYDEIQSETNWVEVDAYTSDIMLSACYAISLDGEPLTDEQSDNRNNTVRAFFN